MNPNTEKHQKFLEYLLNRSQNRKCADCGALNPSWASVTLGLFLCHNCAGAHRSLGAEKSMIKSISINEWNTEELRRMFVGGNSGHLNKSKQFYEKYSNCSKLIQKLDEKVSAHKKEIPDDSFLDFEQNKQKFTSQATIKHKSVVKMSDQFHVTSEENSTEKEQIKIVKEPKAPKQVAPPVVKETVHLGRTKLNTKELKKSVSNTRSPFTFSPQEINSDSDIE
ncbi:AGD9 [Enterospora canceri]|uniref:AGD9 n=1 Tax=Enterospora canceri TaxID=1081671 RepID=A0A1Y1S6D4_9MICR|nr:AGD9 [Enterospora canceri]